MRKTARAENGPWVNDAALCSLYVTHYSFLYLGGRNTTQCSFRIAKKSPSVIKISLPGPERQQNVKIYHFAAFLSQENISYWQRGLFSNPEGILCSIVSTQEQKGVMCDIQTAQGSNFYSWAVFRHGPFLGNTLPAIIPWFPDVCNDPKLEINFSINEEHFFSRQGRKKKDWHH